MRNRLFEQILNEKRVDAFNNTNSTYAFYIECLNDIMNGTIADMVGDGDVMSDGYEMHISFEISDQHIECNCDFKDGTYRLYAYVDHEPEHKYQGSTLEELIADVKSIGNA